MLDLAALPLALLLAGEPAGATPAPRHDPTTDEWVARYRQEPRPDLLPLMLWGLDREGKLDDDDGRLEGFLSELFREPGANAPYLVHNVALSASGRHTLLVALWLSGQGEAAHRIARTRGLPAAERFKGPAPDLRRAPLEVQRDVERLWGAYLVAGDPALPRHLVEVLDRPAPRGNAWHAWRDATALARFSLAEHAVKDPEVEALLRAEAARRRGPARPVLAGILYQLGARASAQARQMTRVIALRAEPGADGKLGPARRVTVHRLGEGLGRIELSPDAKRRNGLLTVVAEPDVWELEAGTRAGSHRVDPGPAYAFRAPVAAPRAVGALGLELGLEFDWLRARKATPTRREVDGAARDAWEVEAGGNRVTLLADPGSERPRRLTVERGGRVLVEVEYLDYARDLPPELDLFTALPVRS